MPKLSPQPYSILRKVFELDGWQYVGTTGDHMQMKKSGYLRRIVIPKYKEVPVFIILFVEGIRLIFQFLLGKYQI